MFRSPNRLASGTRELGLTALIRVSPLICAAGNGHTATAQVLVGANANLEAADEVLLLSVVDPCVRGWEIESHVSVRASEPTSRGREIIFNLPTVYNTIIHCFSVKFMFFGVSIYRN